MKYCKWSLVFFSLTLFLSSCFLFERASRSTRTSKATVQNGIISLDTSNKKTNTSKIAQLKAYKDVITVSAITSKGLFTVHKVNDRYFFEIPNQILNKDVLLVSRIEQGAANVRVGDRGYAGDEIGESEIEFSIVPGNKLFIRLVSFTDRSSDTSANGMYRTVMASNLQPIQAAFDIKAFTPDSSAAVVDVTDFLNSDNPLLYFDGDGKKKMAMGSWQKDRSYISEIKAFPLNVELHAVNTYLRNEVPATFGLNVSFVLLPQQPMKPRYYDKRVGYFTRGYFDYDAPEGFKISEIVTRWRLEPKEEDKEKYLRGELVEPQKPIVYYIDPATPKKWVPYLVQGVNDWQKAFEKAGFKNAIYALEAPANDSSFSLYDARHNAIIYKASRIPNARGPQIHDPRTGEILETHIDWYHNVQQLIHDWYMVQASPNDAGARKMVFDDSLMGQLIRFVCCHEVGHTLGLRHNLGASSTVPTDSLRSKTYLDKNGFCPSIMDYARFNYVAQPEDHLTREELMPRIGVYDEWAIEWGYRWLPQLKTQEQEEAYMNQWIIASLKKDKRLWWGEGEAGLFTIVADPRVQSEDLGDDAVKASYYGIQNLKRVMSHLTEWAIQPNKDYEGLNRMYLQVIDQYNRYIMHVANLIGNKYSTEKKAGQAGAVIEFIPKTVQKSALRFLAKELFETPEWLYNKDIFALVGGDGDNAYVWPQRAVINWVVTFTSYMTMSYAQMQQPKDAYGYDEFLTDIENEIWRELRNSKPISFARRNLQKAYTEQLIVGSVPIPISPVTQSMISEKMLYDAFPIYHKHVNAIINQINKQLPHYKDEASRSHLIEVRRRLLEALNVTRFPQGNVSTSPAPLISSFKESRNEKVNEFFQPKNSMKYSDEPVGQEPYPSCWYQLKFDFINQK
jgi:hypothetical protein